MDDLRQAAIEYFRRIIDATNTDGDYNLGFIDGLEFCISHLSTMPSTQPEQKKGKWIKDKTTQLYCSACGQYGVYSEKFGTLHTLYCPNCGAKMEEER